MPRITGRVSIALATLGLPAALAPSALSARVPAGARIPAAARVVRVTVSRGLPNPGIHGALRRPLVVRDQRKARRIAALVNALPAVPPGQRVQVCPADFGIVVTLSFRRAPHGRPLAVAHADPFGCGGVTLDIRGAHQPPLSGGRKLVLEVSSVLHVRLIVGPGF